MKISSKRTSAFTLPELMVAAAVSAILSIGIIAYSSTALRMLIRNMATNHSHETARGSLEKLLSQVHNSATRLQLVTYDGTNYTDVTAAVSADQDPYTQQYLSNRANGVRFMVPVGGPFKLTGNGNSGVTTIGALDTTMAFDVGSSGFEPKPGDKVQIPLISRDFQINTVTPPTTGTVWAVTVDKAIGSTIATIANSTPSWKSTPITTAVIYRRVAYVVMYNQLRLDSNLPVPPYPKAAITPFTDTSTKKGMALIKTNVTSPKPFSLLFPTSTSTVTDAANLRVSLESYDLLYSARFLQNGTTTLQAIIPSRNQPAILSTN